MNVPKRIVAAVFVSILGSVSAQVVTMTVPGLGDVLTGNDASRTLTCNNSAMTISGNGNKLTLKGSCTQVTVNGNKNVVSVALVGQIVMNGNGNTATWVKSMKGVKPLTRVAGSGNKILKK